MTKEQYLEACAARYEQLQALNKLNDFYDYEVEFVRIWQDMGREVLENNIGTLSKDKRKKKPHDTGSRDH
jgi:superfamily I DNA/RNA helicase